jgi:hypothetical protein
VLVGKSLPSTLQHDLNIGPGSDSRISQCKI